MQCQSCGFDEQEKQMRCSNCGQIPDTSGLDLAFAGSSKASKRIATPLAISVITAVLAGIAFTVYSTQLERPLKPEEIDGCSITRTNITMLRTAFQEGEASPSQLTALLNRAATEWTLAATSAFGSEEKWMNEMAELSLDLGGYLIAGTPSNGEQILSQLEESFRLYPQFCD